MKANFSESSFGFAYTHELLSFWENHIVKAAYIPSTRKEGMKGGGYDVKLTTMGFIYCAQFKRSEHIDSENGNEVKHIGRPYRRFEIAGINKRGFEQHEGLLALEKKGVLVEYVVPKFIERDFLDHFFLKKELKRKVFRLKPSVVKSFQDTNKHMIVSNPSWTHVRRCSSPVTLRSPYDWGEITENGFSDAPQSEKNIGDQLKDCGEGMLSLIEEREGYKGSVLEPSQKLDAREAVLPPLDGEEVGFPILPSSDVSVVRKFYTENFESNPVETLREISRVLLDAELFVFSEKCDCL